MTIILLICISYYTETMKLFMARYDEYLKFLGHDVSKIVFEYLSDINHLIQICQNEDGFSIVLHQYSTFELRNKQFNIVKRWNVIECVVNMKPLSFGFIVLMHTNTGNSKIVVTDQTGLCTCDDYSKLKEINNIVSIQTCGDYVFALCSDNVLYITNSSGICHERYVFDAKIVSVNTTKYYGLILLSNGTIHKWNVYNLDRRETIPIRVMHEIERDISFVSTSAETSELTDNHGKYIHTSLVNYPLMNANFYNCHNEEKCLTVNDTTIDTTIYFPPCECICQNMDYTISLLQNGTIISWIHNRIINTYPGKYLSLKASDSQCIALREDGVVVEIVNRNYHTMRFCVQSINKVKQKLTNELYDIIKLFSSVQNFIAWRKDDYLIVWKNDNPFEGYMLNADEHKIEWIMIPPVNDNPIKSVHTTSNKCVIFYNSGLISIIHWKNIYNNYNNVYINGIEHIIESGNRLISVKNDGTCEII